MLQDIIYWGKNNNYSKNIIVVVNFFLCIHQLSSFHVLAISAERQFDLDLRSEGIQREIRGSGWRMGGDTRQQGQVQCCDNALSPLQAVVMPEIDWGGGVSDSFIMCLGRHARQTRGNDDTLDGEH